MTGLTPEEASLRFEQLQRKLLPLWDSIQQLSMDEQTIVVVPSITIDTAIASVMQAYEERFLFLLFLLRQPHARLIYVTSETILPSIVDYYMGLLPGVITSHARQRLYLLSPLDGSRRPLTEKLLERPRFIERIRSLIPNPDRAHLIPYNTTELERDLALRLGIPMYGADPRFFHFGTKTGCRKLFAEENVPHPIGYENLNSVSDVVEAIQRIRRKKPGVEKVIVKLNEGVSGEGNAVVDLRQLGSSSDPDERREIESRLKQMRFELKDANYEEYFVKLKQRGGVVEELIFAEEVRSPSVQLRITPLGELQLLSTHDQLLGGPSGQSYLGARFPADSAYASIISEQAAKIGERLSKEGVIGRFAVDFVVVRRLDGPWDPYAIEINLRKGGTTHPFLTLQFLTDGYYDPQKAQFIAPSGRFKYFVASDHVESTAYKSLTPDDLFEMVIKKGLHFNQSTQIGVVFHMISAISEHGRLGLTAVGESHEQAYQIYNRTLQALKEEAEIALNDGGLPWK
ncbi:peptide ligase PGM1-related protein [bacterium]|nr:peptide ligase PGM1-related protein [bacterium]